MVCPTCGLDNDPASTTCARCNTALATAPVPGPAAPDYPPAPQRSARLPWLAAAAVALLVAIVAGGVVLYRDRGTTGDVGGDAGAGDVLQLVPTTRAAVAEPTGTTGPSVRDQAVAIDRLLEQSVASRRKLNDAIDLVNRCTGLSRAVSDMRAVGAERQQQLGAVGSAEMSALPNGEQLRTTLGNALSEALDADQRFVDWAAPTVTGGCADTGRRRTAFGQAQAASTRAQAAKKQFLALWNPVAGQLGLAQRSNTDV